MVIQQTLVPIKPGGIAKSLTGSIITTLSERGLRIVGVKIVKVSKELAETIFPTKKIKKEIEYIE